MRADQLLRYVLTHPVRLPGMPPAMRGPELAGGYPALDQPGGDLPDPLVGVLGAVQPAGSAAWWRTVRTVLAVSAEHLEHEERDVLPVWLPGLSMSRRRELGRQWCAFMAAWRPEVPAR
jgi:hypothetical protein